MKFLLFTSCLITSLACPLAAKTRAIPIDQAQTIKPATIKVLLEDHQDSLLLEVKGSYKVFCPHTNVLLYSGFSPKRTAIRSTETGLFWGEGMPGTYSMRIVPQDKNTTIFVNGIQYRGCMEIYDIGGTLRAINEVDIENYLRSCLATDFEEVQEKELLNALAIIARTNAYHRALKNQTAPWHVVAKDVGYRGFAVTLQNFRIEQSIGDTKHVVMTYQNKPFAAAWTENSAGKTATFSHIFQENTPGPKGINLEVSDAQRLKSAWSFQIAKKELATLAHLASLSHVALFSEKESGKVYAIKLEDGDKTKTLDFQTLQTALGKTKLQSNDFVVENLGDSIRFKGFGQGCGVGLCLHTATSMAHEGCDAKKILSTFFQGTSLEKIKTLPESAE